MDSCHVLQVGTVGSGLSRKVCHYSPMVGARHCSCQGQGGILGRYCCYGGPCEPWLWVGMEELDVRWGKSLWGSMSMVNTGYCAAQILTWFWPGWPGVASWLRNWLMVVFVWGGWRQPWEAVIPCLFPDPLPPCHCLLPCIRRLISNQEHMFMETYN